MSAFQPPNKCIFTVNCFFYKEKLLWERNCSSQEDLQQVHHVAWAFDSQQIMIYYNTEKFTVFMHTLFSAHQGLRDTTQGHSFQQLQGQREIPPAWTWGAQSGGLCSSLNDAAATCLFAASTSRKNELICQRHSDHCWQGTACNSTYIQALPKMQAQAAKHPLPLGLVKTEGHSWQYTPPLE